MGGDDLADGVGVEETDVEDEGDEMLLQDYGLLVEIEGYEDPSCEKGFQSEKRRDGILLALLAHLYHV